MARPLAPRSKLLLLFAAAALALMAGLHGLQERAILPEFDRMEVEVAGRQLSRAIDAIEAELAALSGVAAQWVQRPLVRAAVAGGLDVDRVARVFADELLARGDVDFVYLIGPDAEELLGRACAADETRAPIEIDTFAADTWFPLHPYFVRHETHDVITDVRMTDQGPVLLSANEIGEAGAPRPSGWLIVGRFLTAALHRELLTRTLVAFRYWDATGLDLPARERAALMRIQRGEVSVSEPRSESVRYAYGVISSAFGGPSLLLRVDVARDLSAQASLLADKITAGTVGVIAIVFLIMYIALNHLAPRPSRRRRGEAGPGRDDDLNDLSEVDQALETIADDAGALSKGVHEGALAELPSVWRVLSGRGPDAHLPDDFTEWLRALQVEWGSMRRRSKRVVVGLRQVREITRLHHALAFSGGRRERVSLERLAEDAIAATSDVDCRHPIEFVRAYDPMPDVEVDRDKLTVVVEILVRNARRSIAAAPPGDHAIHVRVGRLDDDWALIEVGDTAGAVDDERVRELFRPTARPESEIELYAAAAHAGELGGSLTASRESQGLVFRIELPVEVGVAAVTDASGTILAE